MRGKRILAIMCSFLLTIGSIVCAATAEKTEQYMAVTAAPTIEPIVPSVEPTVPTVKPAPSVEPTVPTVEPDPSVEPTVPTVEPDPSVEPITPGEEPIETVEPAPEIKAVEIVSDKENKYCEVGTDVKLYVKDLLQEEVVYRWESLSDEAQGWKAIKGEDKSTCNISVSNVGKIQYRCIVTPINLGKSLISNVITKIGYRKTVTVAVGNTVSVADIFGSQLPELNGKVTFNCSKFKNIVESKKNVLTVKCFSKKVIKIKWKIEKGESDEIALKIISPKAMKAVELQRKASILITKNGTCLTVSYKDIKGVRAIKFQPKGLKINTVKLSGNSSKGDVTYNYTPKFKMKKFRVRFGYLEAGKSKLQYTKWFWVKNVKRK